VDNQAQQMIQRVLESGDFEHALPLIESYGRSAIQAAQAAETFSEKSEVLRTSAAFLQDRLHLARVMRAQLAGKIALCSGLGIYQDASRLTNTWQLEG
jgi:hypothetical protein